jgi:Methyltransferase domain
MTATSRTASCRVCGKEAELFFAKKILGKHQVTYFKCSACGHVQTEQPFWLEEAYRNRDYQLDVGMADRCVWSAETMVALARRLKIGPEEPCLDWGAGTGLFVRLCRDYGLNFFYFDPYPQNIFACGFEADPAGGLKWTCVSTFEVAEHLADPLKDFGKLFRLSPRYIFFSTWLYAGQSAEWWYFTDNGQHVAFYTRRSLELIGEHYGYRLASNGRDLHLFSKEPVRDRILNACRKRRQKEARRYRRKYGSRIDGDFENVANRLR